LYVLPRWCSFFFSFNFAKELLQPVPQGSTINELRAFARQQATYFRYGTTSPAGTVFAKASEGFWNSVDWVKAQIQIGANAARKQAEAYRKKVSDEL
jgi:hypothetical protein